MRPRALRASHSGSEARHPGSTVCSVRSRCRPTPTCADANPAAARAAAANVAGWVVAFTVSFLGQWQLTFRARRAPAWQAARRFLAISFVGFAANECAYALLLQVSRLRYDIILAGVLVVTAVMTYLL